MHYRISYLLNPDEKSRMTLEEAKEVTGLTEAEILEQLEALDVQHVNKQLVIESVTPLKWTETFLGVDANSFELDIEDRQRMIYLMIYAEEDNASVFHFQDFLKVSRGTVLADIKDLREMLAKEEITITYDRSRGYSLAGHENHMVRLAKNNVSTLLQSPAGKFALHYFISQSQLDLYAQVKDRIEGCIQQTNYELVLSRLDEMIYFSVLSKKLLQQTTFNTFAGEEKVKEIELFRHTKKLLAGWLGQELPETNVALYTVCLLSVLQGDIHEPAFDFLLQLSAEMIHLMEAYSAIQFKQFRELLFDFYHHLVPAYFRIKYDLVLSNTLLETIYNEYHSLFELTRKALAPLADLIKKEIPDDEVAYFTILFGGFIKAENEVKNLSDNVRALIVCPNGVSSSLILESELKQLFPSMHFKGVSTTESIRNIPTEDYDLIFSTVPIEELEKKVYVVNPIMNQLKKNQLINEVQRDWLIPGFSFPEADEIIEAMKPYITLNKGVTEEQLYRILNRRIHKQLSQTEEKPRLSDLLKEEHIYFREKVYRYEDAIRIAANPLVENHSIAAKYIDAMIENVYRRGPYIFLGNGIALPHARPEDGVHEMGFSMLVLNEPIALADDPQAMVDRFIVLAAADNTTHLDALSDLNALIRNKPLLDAFLKSENAQEIVEVLKRI